MKKTKFMKEGMWLVAPCLAGVVLFGGLIHLAWEQDKENEKQAVTLVEASKKLTKYDKANKEFAFQNKQLKGITESMASEIKDLKLNKTGLENSIAKLKQDSTLCLDGKVYIARQQFTASASAYTQRDEEGTADGVTKTGTQVKEGRTIAVDPKQIPLGSTVYIESDSPLVGGFYVAEDTGGAIDGNRIDIFMNSKEQAFKFGRQDIKVTVLEGADIK